MTKPNREVIGAAIAPGVIVNCPICEAATFVGVPSLAEMNLGDMMEVKETLGLEPYVEFDLEEAEMLFVIPDAVECPECGAVVCESGIGGDPESL